MAVLALLKGGVVLYRFYAQNHKGHKQIFGKGKRFAHLFPPQSVKQGGNRDGGYGFAKMIALVQASQKLKDLEHLYFARALNEPQIETQTIRDLIKSLSQERIKFKRHIDDLKSRALEPISTKKIRSLLFYLRVIDECIQDSEVILTNRVLPQERNDKSS